MDLIIFAVLAIICLWGIANEENLVKAENRMWKYVEAFFTVLKEEIKNV